MLLRLRNGDRKEEPNMKHTYDKEANAVYIYLCEKPYSFGRRLDDERSIDYAHDGTPIGIEILYVSSGVNVTGLPESDELIKLFEGINIPAYNYEAKADDQAIFSSISKANLCYAIADGLFIAQDDIQQCTFLHTRQIPRSIRFPVAEEVTA